MIGVKMKGNDWFPIEEQFHFNIFAMNIQIYLPSSSMDDIKPMKLIVNNGNAIMFIHIVITNGIVRMVPMKVIVMMIKLYLIARPIIIIVFRHLQINSYVYQFEKRMMELLIVSAELTNEGYAKEMFNQNPMMLMRHFFVFNEMYRYVFRKFVYAMVIETVIKEMMNSFAQPIKCPIQILAFVRYLVLLKFHLLSCFSVVILFMKNNGV